MKHEQTDGHNVGRPWGGGGGTTGKARGYLRTATHSCGSRVGFSGGGRGGGGGGGNAGKRDRGEGGEERGQCRERRRRGGGNKLQYNINTYRSSACEEKAETSLECLPIITSWLICVNPALPDVFKPHHS